MPAIASASFFFVNSTDDTPDAAPGDGLCADASSNCSLRAAVMEANALPGTDTINLGIATYTLSIPGNAEHAAASGDLDILGPVNIQGAGADSSIIDGGGIDRIFEIIDGGAVTISRLTVQNGVAGANTPGYFVNFVGGGIFNVGNTSSVILDEVEIRDNQAQSGGGVYTMFSTMQITKSTIYDNRATAGNGGGIAEGLAGYLRVYNSTISGNSATQNGGGLATSNNAATLNNVTLVNNTADSDNDGTGNGGGIVQGITAPVLSNSILAGNHDPGGQAPDCTGGITSGGYNVIGDDTGCTVAAAAGDQVGTGLSPVDPLLGPLADNGGPSLTHSLLNGSPAIDSGNPAAPGGGGGACQANDQRGNNRAALAPCDSGALESTPNQSARFTVNSILDQVDGLIGDGMCETAPGSDVCTLRAAIQETNALIGGDEIIVPAGSYVLGIAGSGENAGATGDLDINDDLDLLGAGSTTTIIDADGIDRVFYTHGNNDISISGVTIRNGVAAGGGSNGGGIMHEASGTLSVSDCEISGNEAGNGGGIFTVAFNHLVVDNCVVNDNTATSYGGGIANFTLATTTVRNSTINGNRANIGGGLMNSFLSNATITGTTISNNQAQTGGGIGTNFGNSTVTLANSTISGNRATLGGGGINSTVATDQLNLRNVTITGNRAAGMADGGGISANGTINVRNSIIAGNLDDGGEAPDCSGILTSQGYNLLGNDSACTLAATTGDQVGNAGNPIDPLLGPLTDNGGLTFTHIMLNGSPALNAGNPATPGSGGSACEAADQRGTDRVLNAPCDIGASESVTADLGVTLSGASSTVLPGSTLSYSILVSNAGPDSASGLLLTDTLPDGTSLVEVSGSGWDCALVDTRLSCILASLADGSSSSLTLDILAPDTSGSFSNTVQVSAETVDLDSTDNSATESTNVNAAPVVTTSAIEIWQAGDTLPVVAPDITVSDSDDTHLESATIRITASYQAGVDELRFTDTGNIRGQWDNTTGQLTLSGTDTLGAYQSAIRTIQYINKAESASSGTRTLGYQVNDGDIDSVAVTSQLYIVQATDDTVNSDPVEPVTPPPPDSGPVFGNGGSSSSTAGDSSAGTPGLTELTVEPLEQSEDAPAEDASQDVKNNNPVKSASAHMKPARPVKRQAASSAYRSGRSKNAAPATTATSTAARESSETTISPTTGTAYRAVSFPSNERFWDELDSMKQQMSRSIDTETEEEKIVAGAAKGLTVVLFAGMMNWYIKAGSLLASLLSSIPLWTPFDPLPILSLSRQESGRRHDDGKKQQQDKDKLDAAGSLFDDESGNHPATTGGTHP